MMSCAYVISRFGPSITRLAGRTRPERWENAYELRKSGLSRNPVARREAGEESGRSPRQGRVQRARSGTPRLRLPIASSPVLPRSPRSRESPSAG